MKSSESKKRFTLSKQERGEILADVIERMLDHPASRLEEFIPQNWVKLRKSKATVDWIFGQSIGASGESLYWQPKGNFILLTI